MTVSVAVVDGLDATAGEERDALLLDDAAPLLHDARIDAGEHLRQHFDDGDPRAERGEQARELAADDAAADDEQVLGHALEPEDAVGGDHARMLHVDARQARRLGADAHDRGDRTG